MLGYLKGLLQFGTLRASYRFFALPEMWPTNLFIVIMLLVEWLQRGKEHGMSKNVKLHRVQNDYVFAVIYALLLVLFILFGGQLTSFIYFQF